MISVFIYMIIIMSFFVSLSNNNSKLVIHCFQQPQQQYRAMPLFLIRKQRQQQNYRYSTGSRIEIISNTIITTKHKHTITNTKRNYNVYTLNAHNFHSNENNNAYIPNYSFIYNIHNKKNNKRKKIMQRRSNFLESFSTPLFSINSNGHNNDDEDCTNKKNIDYDTANLNDSNILLEEVNYDSILKSIRKNARKVMQQQQYRNYHNLSKIFSSDSCSNDNNTVIDTLSNNKRIRNNDNNNDYDDSNSESLSSKVNVSSQIVLSDFCIHVQINSNDYNHLPRSVISIVDETLLKIKNYQRVNNNTIPLQYDDNSHDEINNNNVLTRTNHRTMNNIDDTTIVTMPKIVLNDDNIKAFELIQLGSIWFISKKDNENDNDNMIQDIIIEWKKPNRIIDPNFICHDGDYLRIHHQPRRFQNVYQYNWNGDYNQNDNTVTAKNETQPNHHHDNDIDHQLNDDNNNNIPGVIISRNDEKGYIVINKPPMIPVHMTVDNSYENVASCLLHVEKIRRNNNNKKQQQSLEASSSSVLLQDDVTVLTPQRLDQNTSGLLVVATSKLFANYYANLLRMKTKLSQQQQDDDDNRMSNDDNDHIKSSTMNTNRMNHNEQQNKKRKNGHINKLYRCLICLIPTADEEPSLSMDDDINQSRSHLMIEKMGNEIYEYVNTGKIMKHFLEPSIRSPKLFVKDIPDTVSSSAVSSWLVCLLRITKASPIYPVFDDTVASIELAQELWMTTTSSSSSASTTKIKKQQQDDDNYEYNKPKNCYGVMEIEIELLTGRTHQIRGQLSASGYPIVGDVPYGGAVEVWDKEQSKNNYYSYTEERLALQCCQLEFYDPNIIETKYSRKKRKTNINSTLGYDFIEDFYTKISLNVSDRLNTFQLHDAWWTQSLQKYNNINNNENNQQSSNNENDNSSSTIHYSPQNKDLVDDDSPTNTGPLSSSSLPSSSSRAHLLPPRVQLSPGKNKYILLRATHPNDNHETIHWFVKSAPPQECGGSYHGNVAQDLREWIEAIGYNATVTGGGRIDYCPTENTAFIYGSSNGFGKANHELASEIISLWGNGTIHTTYDDTDGLYQKHQ